MKKITITAIFILILLGLVSLTRNDQDCHIGRPAFALCSADSIKNDCCFKFFKVLEGGVIVESLKTREKKATAEFKRCLRSDVGCSQEMTELKTKSAGQIRSICE